MVEHGHADARAETFTRPISRNKLGSEALGVFATGNHELVSQDSGRGVSVGKSVSPIPTPEEAETLTYPLFGQNMLDWRTPRRTHNNVPPCMNVYVKYMEKVVDSRKETLCSSSFPDMVTRNGVVVGKGAAKQDSSVEAQYKSYMVNELEEYLDENLSDSDCLLRL